MDAHRAMPIALLACLLGASLLATPPTRAGSPTSWQLDVVAGVLDDATRPMLARNGAQAAVIWIGGVTEDVGFALRQEDGAWDAVTNDVTGIGQNFGVANLYGLGGTRWAVMAYDDETGDPDQDQDVELWITQNNGQTWTKTHQWSSGERGFDLYALAPASGTLSNTLYAIIPEGDAATSKQYFRKSTDLGATWSAGINLGDDAGGPQSTGTQLVFAVGIAGGIDRPAHSAIYAESNTLLWALLTGYEGSTTSNKAVRVYLLKSEDGGGFWQTPGTGSTLLEQSSINSACTPYQGSYADLVGVGTPLAVFADCMDTVNRLVEVRKAGDATAYFVPSGVSSAPPGGYNGPNGFMVGADETSSGESLAMVVAGSTPKIYYRGSDSSTYGGAGSSVLDLPSNTVGQHLIIADGDALVAYRNSNEGGRLEIKSAEVTGIAAPVAVPADSVAVPGLSGFAMDERGFTGIVRYTSGGVTHVRTLNGAQLTLSPATDNTYCTRSDGVMAFYSAEADGRTYVAYLTCYAQDSSDVTSVRIRGADLGEPFLPDHCDDNFIQVFCTDEISAGQLASPDDEVRHIRSLHQFPIDYSRYGSDLSFNELVRMAWAFTTFDGKAGLVSYTHREDGFLDAGDDKSQVTTVTIDVSGGPVDYSCTTSNLRTGDDYFYAGAQASDVKGFKVYYKPENTNTGAGTLEVQLVGIGVGGSDTRSPRGIGCGNNIVVVAKNDGEILAINVTSGARRSILKDPAHVIVSNALAVEPTGQTAAWIRDGKIQLYDLRNWRFIDNLTAPTGSVNSLVLTYYSKDLYVALMDRVERYATGVLFGSDDFTPNPSADTDNDGVVNSEDPDLDGDGICNSGGPLPKRTRGAEDGCQPGPNGLDPDVDGDGLCNADADRPAGTVGAIYGCKAGDTDDDDDAVPDDADEAPGGAGPGPGGCVNCSGTGPKTDYAFGLSKEAAFGWGLLIVAILAGAGYIFAGPAPMVVGGLATLGIIAAVAFRFWSPWVLVALGGATGVIGFTSMLAKRVGGKT